MVLEECRARGEDDDDEALRLNCGCRSGRYLRSVVLAGANNKLALGVKQAGITVLGAMVVDDNAVQKKKTDDE